MATRGSFNSGISRNTAPLQGPTRTCGHWPATHLTVINGEKTQQCAACYRNGEDR